MRISRRVHPLIVVLTAMLLCGCAGAWSGEPSFNRGILLPDTPSTPRDVQNSVPNVCKGLLDTTPSDSVTARARNDCIFALMGTIDAAYYEYRKTVRGLADTGNAATDIVGIGISSAATLVPGATTKTILSAINTGLSGAKAKIDSDILYSKSITLIVTQMDADRDDWKSRIFTQINDPAKSGNYGMYQAATDLLSYYEAGTWDHALTSLDAQASSNLSNCRAAVKSAQTTSSASATSCGPQLVTAVASGIQVHREALAAYVKGLSSQDQSKLAKSLNLPGQNPLVEILQSVAAATTADQVDAIAAKIKELFGKDI